MYGARQLYPVAVLFLLMLTGCRTYGGYSTVELTQEAIKTEVRQAEDRLQSAQRELRLLEAAASTNPILQSIAKEYQSWYQRHEQLVSDMRTRESTLAESANYRRVSRALGAMITDQRRIQVGYSTLTTLVENVLAPDMDMMPGPAVPEGLYGAYPAVYYRMWQHEMTLTHVLRMHG